MQLHRFNEVASALREQIARGVLSPGSLLPTERELQAAFSVSRTTVRRALATLIEAGWAEQKPNRGVIAKLGPQANSSTQIAFVDHVSLVHKSLFFRLHRLLSERGYSLIHVDSTELGTLGGVQRAADMGCAAAFVWPKVAFVKEGALTEVQSRMPVILVDHSMGEPCELVMSDHFQGAKEAVAHLMSLGRQRIAITGNFTHHEDSMYRFAGYVAAYHEQGRIPNTSDYLFSSPGGSSCEDTRLLSFRLSQTDRPDAIFVLHDMSVPAIVEAVFDAGLRIPQDVAIVGFGNDLPLTFGGVGLTTIAMQWDEVAIKMVDRLIARLASPHAPYRRTLIPTHLVVRGSCGAPPSRWSNEGYEVSSVTVTGRMAPSTSELRVTSLPANSSASGNGAESGSAT